jgi:hypothetical protein
MLGWDRQAQQCSHVGFVGWVLSTHGRNADEWAGQPGPPTTFCCHSSVLWSWPRHLSAQHRNLVPQQQDLNIFTDVRTARDQHKQVKHTPQHQIDQPDSHAAHPAASTGERAAQSPHPGSGHPQGRWWLVMVSAVGGLSERRVGG